MKELLSDPKFWTDVISPFLLIASAFCIAICLGIISGRNNTKEEEDNDFSSRTSNGVNMDELNALKEKHDRRVSEAAKAARNDN
ncbi:hypothetical protein ACFL2R_00525 [Patescibacteria group bacterium]